MFKVEIGGKIIEASSLEQLQLKLIKGKYIENLDYYLSSSKGLVHVEEMALSHLKNALIKELKKTLADLEQEQDLAKIVNIISDGLGSRSVRVLALLLELQKRVQNVK